MSNGKVERQDLLPDNNVSADRPGELEREVGQIAKGLRIKLPQGNRQPILKLITLFTAVGGLSVIGSSFVDIFVPQNVNFFLYITRLVVGFLCVIIAYGIDRRERWAVWLYGMIVVVALIINFWVALIPAAIVVYLYVMRSHFRPSIFDVWVAALVRSFRPQ